MAGPESCPDSTIPCTSVATAVYSYIQVQAMEKWNIQNVQIFPKELQVLEMAPNFYQKFI